MNRYIKTIMIAVMLLFAVSSAQAALLAYLPFDGNTLNVADPTHSGIFQGDPEFVEGVFGQAIDLDGTDAVILENSKSVALGLSQLSISCWYKGDFANQWEDFGALVAKWGETAGGWQLRRWYWEPDGLNVELRGTTLVGTEWAQVDWMDGKWHSIISTWDGALSKIYVDGVEVGSWPATGTILQYMADITIGCKRNSADVCQRFIVGTIDEVRIYDHGLSPAEVAALAVPPVVMEISPINGQQVVDLDTSLSWRGLNPDYTVYMSTNAADLEGTPDNAFKLGVFSSAEVPSAYLTLDYDTTYYWRVDSGGQDGPIWSFTTRKRFGNPVDTLPVVGGLAVQIDSEHVVLAEDSSNNEYVYKALDRSGNGNDAVLLHGYDKVQFMPQYVRSGYTSGGRTYPAIHFDGNLRSLSVGPNPEVFQGDHYSWFLVIGADPAHVDERIVNFSIQGGYEEQSYNGFGTYTSTKDELPIYKTFGRKTDGTWTPINEADVNSVVSGVTWSPKLILSSCDYSWDVVRQDINKANVAQSSSGAVTGFPVGELESIDLSPGGGQIFNLYEFVLYSRTLSPAEEDAVGSYLEHKYGLTTYYPDANEAELTDCSEKWAYQLYSVVSNYENADLDKDCSVDFGDFSILADNWMDD
ncbi:MAG: LamG domain-containing protein [Dehalococcoidia bacterium]|nr:LamG domain-containing protein [Dehalococcoidia bacterium]